MDLSSSAFLRLLSLKGAGTALTLRLGPEGVSAGERSNLLAPFAMMTAPPSIKSGLWASSISIPLSGERQVVLHGAKTGMARNFISEVESRWRSYTHGKLAQEEDKIAALLLQLQRLDAPKAYPSACATTAILREATRLEDALLSRLPEDAIGQEQSQRLAPIRSFATTPVDLRDRTIERFVAAELERWKEFFDTVESKPLTPEQRLSIVVDEDATLVLAGAGSGKTSVITAKAAYLLRAGIRPAEEILLLAFAKDAAKEMSERIEARCGMPIEARTFHALAYDIIGAVEGAKPPLAAHATDDTAFLDLIRQILRDLMTKVAEVAGALISWFTEFLVEQKDDWDYKTKHDYYKQLEKLDLRTLQGEQVKSREELSIANWLYQNGIAYEYEPDYEHKVATGGRRSYTPDFRLTDSGVYLEHFGVRRARGPDGTERLVTAPFVDREEYLEDMAWKRQLHKDQGTILIETFSYEQKEGRLLEALQEKLSPYITIKPRPAAEIFDRVVELGQADAFTRMLGTFLRQFKSGGYSVAQCLEKSLTLQLGKRAQAFLKLFEPVYAEYRHRLGDRIDFEDMILRAAHYAEHGRYQSPFKHILVDEFQDISQSRARLIKALKAQHRDARLFAVGDDWQSIYRFAGSDIHIMRNFGREFGGTFGTQTGVHRSVDLGRTFRSVDKIALAARAFVLKNPAQIVKAVVPAGVAPRPAIQIAWTRKGGDDAALLGVLQRLAALPAPEGRKTSVLLLGRYRFIDPGLYQLQKRFPQVTLSFKTIHASKGLEADHVVLLKADAGRVGFPSEIADDPLLSLVSPEAEPFENAEERRVMYVAMTRARSTLTIIASEARPSAFVQELLADPFYDLDAPASKEGKVETCAECAGRLLPDRSKEGGLYYRCEHVAHCGNILSACPSCGSGLPIRGNGHNRCSACAAEQPACPSCNGGWLVKRDGKFGAFYSCTRFPTCSGKAKVKEIEDPRSGQRTATY